MSRIGQSFQNKKAFIPFLTAGDPDIETSKENYLQAAKAGADLLEIGIPFSDPTAEGPVIMEADNRALQAGTTTDRVFALTKELRREVDIPLVYMTYANVVFHYGTERFAKAAAESGADGIILPDVPYEEKKEFDEAFAKNGMDLISMIAPTSEDRIRMIAKEAKGFLYVVSSLGVTGTRSEIHTDISALTRAVREVSDIPCAVGFGISNPSQAKAMASQADGAIVGSAIVRIVAEYGKDAPEHVGTFVREMADAVHGL